MQTENPFDPKTGAAIADMINAFLKWPLPESVRVDACCLDPKSKHRTGTNLLTVVEAMQLMQEVVCPIIAEYQDAQSATQLQTIKEREARIRELEGALRATTDECKQTLKDIGGCDHSVGVCCCDLIRIIEDAEALLALARPAHTEGLADKGGEA